MRSLTTSAYVPFIRTRDERNIADSVMQDVDLVRVSAETRADRLQIPQNWRLWLDPSFDGYDDAIDRRSTNCGPGSWEAWIRSFRNHEALLSPKTADAAHVRELVKAVLARIAARTPAVISVPQMTYSAGTGSHKINEGLAKEAGEWKVRNWPDGIFVLPVVVTDYKAYRIKTAGWGPKVQAIQRAFEASRASAVWVVHAGLNDLSGVGRLDKEEFPKLIEFHLHLRDALPSNTTMVAGPYWAINLILWARGIVDVPAISCGSGYRYYRPSSFVPQPTNRIAIPPLRRWCSVTPDLERWIKDAKEGLPPHDDVASALRQIEARFSTFLGTRGRRAAVRQTAEFYENWIQQIAAVQKQGRALFLFQDFSSALVNGSRIGTPLPREGSLSAEARKPGAIAQQFMLQCLPR